jgi:phosphomannomutase
MGVKTLSEIFKAYDIRGIYPSEINEELMEKIGRAYADFISGQNIAVGHDMRVSSEKLKDAFIKGVLKQGKNVLSFGLSSTPGSYFACTYLKADGCAMITASHNPKEYNGVKFTRENAIPISGDTGIKDIEKKIINNDFKEVEHQGKLQIIDISQAYKQHLKLMIKNIKGLNVVVDAANGMGSQEFLSVQNEMDIDCTNLYFEIDGTFPNHDANPMAEGATDILKKTVLEKNADLGIAFDGDADRVFFVDNKGELIQGDFITALIAEEVLETNPGSVILYDLRSSNIVPERIKELGGNGFMSRVGHSFIKEQMREHNSIFSGELSGHFYFKFEIEGNSAVYDSGIVMAIKMLNLLSRKSEKLSDLIEPLRKYSASGEINSKVENKDEKIKQIKEKYSEGKLSELDGIRIDFDDWWFNVRASNTEPFLRLNLEAKTKELMEQKRDEVLELIRN